MSGTVVVVWRSLVTSEGQAEAFQFGGEAENREQNRKKEEPAPDETVPIPAEIDFREMTEEHQRKQGACDDEGEAADEEDKLAQHNVGVSHWQGNLEYPIPMRALHQRDARPNDRDHRPIRVHLHVSRIVKQPSIQGITLAQQSCGPNRLRGQEP